MSRVILTASSPVSRTLLPVGLDVLRFAGLEPVVFDTALDTGERCHYLAGSDEQRAAELRAALLDESLAGIMFAGGGYGSQRTLEVMDWSGIDRVTPKVVCGYSDVTGILEALVLRLGWASLMGPMVACNDFSDAYTFASLRRFLFEPEQVRELVYEDAVTVVGGTAQGITLGGNLCLLSDSIGSDTSRTASGAILMIEDESEEDYRIDRMLTQMRRSGYLEGVAGVIAGTWDGCGTPEEIDAVLVDRLSDLGVPVITWADIGHGGRFQTYPIGVRAELDADRKVLRFPEPVLVPSVSP